MKLDQFLDAIENGDKALIVNGPNIFRSEPKIPICLGVKSGFCRLWILKVIVKVRLSTQRLRIFPRDLDRQGSASADLRRPQHSPPEETSPSLLDSIYQPPSVRYSISATRTIHSITVFLSLISRASSQSCLS